MTAKKTSILLVGTGSLLNYGCEAIVQGTYVILKSVLPNCQIYVASDDKEYDRTVLPKDIHLISYKRRFTIHRLYKGILRRVFKIGDGSTVRMIYSIGKKYDIILSCGGDNFCENPDRELYTLLIDLMKIGEVAYKNEKKYILWGASVGPFSQKYNLNIVIESLNKCQFIAVRENLSYEYLSAIKELKSPVCLVADSAFCLPADSQISLKKQSENIYIGLNINHLAIDHSVHKENQKGFILNLFNQLDFILEKNPTYYFICIPHVISDNGGPQDDIAFMNRYIAFSKFTDRISILPAKIGAIRTKGYIQQMDLLIAARMHCCVGGISTATPTLFITYSNKGKGMSYYAYQHHNYEIECQELTHAKFPLLINNMIEKRSIIKEYLTSQQAKFREEAMKGGKHVLEIAQSIL